MNEQPCEWIREFLETAEPGDGIGVDRPDGRHLAGEFANFDGRHLWLVLDSEVIEIPFGEITRVVIEHVIEEHVAH
jgi:hypothetical protein